MKRVIFTVIFATLLISTAVAERPYVEGEYLPAACGITHSQAQTYANPILHLDYSDPDVCMHGGDYWMTASSFNHFPGLPILHSKDLIHWDLVNYALYDYPGPLRPGDGVWAPSIRYHDGWFYIFVGDPDRGIFMVRSQDPLGRWEPPVWLVREKGFIDPCPLWDDDGRAWLSHALAGSRAGLKSVVLVAPMAPDGTSLTGPGRIVFDGHCSQPTIEGTKFYKRGGSYYLFCPAGGVATGWQTVLRSSSPLGPWEDKVVMAWQPGCINGPHQGAWVQTPDGADWFLHFQDKGAYGRIVHLQPMSWQGDGWPVIGFDGDGDGVGAPVESWSAPMPKNTSQGNGRKLADKPGAPSACPATGLPLEWQFPAVPKAGWSFALPNGGIRLYSVEQEAEGNLWDCPNLLLQKFPAERFSTVARLVFRPNPQLKQRCETGGLIVMGTDYAGLRLSDTEDGARLLYFECLNADKGGQESSRELLTLPWSRKPANLPYQSGNVPPVKYPDLREASVLVRLEVEAREREGNVPDAVCSFSFSVDGENWTPAGSGFTAQAGRWVGAKFGFFCNRYAPKNDSGCLDVIQISVVTQGR